MHYLEELRHPPEPDERLLEQMGNVDALSIFTYNIAFPRSAEEAFTNESSSSIFPSRRSKVDNEILESEPPGIEVVAVDGRNRFEPGKKLVKIGKRDTVVEIFQLLK